jgi:hypothetical protein
MKNRGLLALLAVYFLSCSTLNVTQKQYYAPKAMILDISHNDRVSILEDTDGDGIFDTSFDYDETQGKPDYIPGNSQNFYLLELKGVETIVPFSYKNRSPLPAPPAPEYKNNPFERNLRLDVRWAY